MTSYEVRENAAVLTRVMRSSDQVIGRALSLLDPRDLERLAQLTQAELPR